jgi:glucose/arabinose dehydrogenase
MSLRRRTWAWAGLAALATLVGAPAVAQQTPSAAAQPQGAQPPAGAEQPRRGGGAGGGGGGGRPQTQPLGDGPWDVTTEQARIHVTVVTKGLQNPWGLAFLPNGDMLVTERPGRLRIVRGGVLDATPIAGMPTIRAASIGGLQDVVLHPDFRRNQLVYFSYSKPDAQDEKLSSLAVARGRFDGGGALTDVEDIFVAKDWYSAAMSTENGRCCGQGPSDASFGARMAFGRDGTLYVASGDRNWGEKAQEPSSHLGKILRIRDDGKVPRDNPFVGKEGYLPEIYTLGHRNPTGLTVNPANGEIWSTEFGPRGGDELNHIEAGKNYGWILVTHGNHYNNDPVARGAENVPGMTDPVLYWVPSTNPGNIAFYTGNELPGWRGNLLMAAMSRALVRISFDATAKPVGQERLLADLGQRFRDVRQGPDGAVYLLTDERSGAMLKIAAQKP